MKLHVIITGATGMVGEGVLHEAIAHPDVESILLLTRKPTGVTHPKVREVVHNDFYDLSQIEDQLTGYNACLFCLGVTSVGKNEPEYRRLTYDLTMHVAETLARRNSDMTFCYISGKATNEQGPQMWQRVKGKTETDLQKLNFKSVYLFRPGYLHPTPGLKNTLKYYKYITWMYPLIKLLYPSGASTLAELGRAMLNVAAHGYPKRVLEVSDIVLEGK
jgi:uncharacterized protein YbjT (DUF2867 family)